MSPQSVHQDPNFMGGPNGQPPDQARPSDEPVRLADDHPGAAGPAPGVADDAIPPLSAGGPLGGHVLSHDQVEAVLMRRAGYEVRVLPAGDLGGEELRDRYRKSEEYKRYIESRLGPPPASVEKVAAADQRVWSKQVPEARRQFGVASL